MNAPPKKMKGQSGDYPISSTLFVVTKTSSNTNRRTLPFTFIVSTQFLTFSWSIDLDNE